MKTKLSLMIILLLFFLAYSNNDEKIKADIQQASYFEMPVEQTAAGKTFLTEREYGVSANGGTVVALLSTVINTPEVIFDSDWLVLTEIKKDIAGKFKLKLETVSNTHVYFLSKT